MGVLSKKEREDLEEGERVGGSYPCCYCPSSDAVSLYKKVDERGVDYIDGYCFSCGEYIPPKLAEGLTDGDTTLVNKREVQLSDLDKNELARIAGLSSNGSRLRKIDLKFMEMYGVKVDKDEDGKVTHHYYPVTKDEGSGSEITGYKVRIMPKRFESIGDTKNSEMFGQAVFKDGKVNVNKKFLLITEGELDCVALQQVMTSHGNSNYTNAVVSLPNGSASAVKSIQNNWKWINTFETVVLFFDMDDPGREAALKVAKKLPLGKCKIAKFSDKDPCDMLKNGKGKELYEAFWKAESFSPEGVLAGSSLWDLVSTPLQQSDARYPWSGLDTILHGIRTSEMVTLTAGCVDAGTEFLTPTGWKYISDYQDGDLVGEYTEDGKLQFKAPSLYHKYKADKLWHFHTKYGVDQCLSDEHTVVYVSEKENLQKKQFSELKELHENSVRGFSGRFITTFGTPDGLQGIPLTDEQIRLMVAVIGDGYFPREGDRVIVRIKKDRKKQRLVKLLESAGIDYKRRETSPYGGFEAFTFTAPMHTKNYDDFWWMCNNQQLSVICDEVVYWDGNQRNQFYSSDKCDIDFLQYAFATQGLRTTVLTDDRADRLTDRPCYRLQITSRTLCGIKSHAGGKVKINEFNTIDGFKYCFTTSTGMWVMRRNNRIAVTGNSGVAKSSFARMLMHHLQKTTDSNVGGIFLEESVKKTSLQVMSLEAGKPFYLPETEYTDKEMRAAYDSTLGTNQYYFFDDFASQDFESVQEAILYMAKACNCKYIFLDHISMLVSGGEHGDERRALDAICTKLRAMCQQLDITLFIVTHLKRPQGTPHEEGGQTSLAQLRGSAGIAQLSDIVIGFERNGQADDPIEQNTTHFRVLKNRFSGELGLACSVFYDKKTGRARQLSEDEVSNMNTEDTEFGDYERSFDEELMKPEDTESEVF